MIEPSRDEPWLNEVSRVLREPVAREPGAVDAIVEAVGPYSAEARAHRAPSSRGGRWTDGVRHWLTGRSITLTPLSATGWAAAVAVTAAVLVHGLWPVGTEPPVATDGVHQFVLVAPEATSVSLVGDFNGWDPGVTPLVRRGDVWEVEVALDPGRHVYSFVVDGERWVPDAGAPLAPDDDFGRPSSVILVES